MVAIHTLLGCLVGEKKPATPRLEAFDGYSRQGRMQGGGVMGEELIGMLEVALNTLKMFEEEDNV